MIITRQWLSALFLGSSLLMLGCNSATKTNDNKLETRSMQPQSTIAAARAIEYEWMSIANWYERFEQDKAEAQQGTAQLVFVGDSITQGWDHDIWNQYFAPYDAVNFGVGGDHTGNLLWRLEHGQIEKLNPKAVVVMIGVNNFGLLQDTPEDVFAGVSAVVSLLQKQYPQAKILLNAILPHEQFSDSNARAPIAAANQLIKSLDDGKQVFFYDFGSLLLQADGSISSEVMPDFLHPAKPGYQILADAMQPILSAWLK